MATPRLWLSALALRRKGFGSSRRPLSTKLLGVLAGACCVLGARAQDLASPETEDPAARRRTLTVSKRTLEAAGGSIEDLQRGWVVSSRELLVASDVFAEGAPPVGVELPERLGGGYLFHQRYERAFGSSTRLYRSRSWTGPLEPWLSLPVQVDRVVVGWDRLYFLAKGRAFSLIPGVDRALPLEPFPRVPVASDLRFWGEESAAVLTPLAGWLVTHDGGRSFSPGELPAEPVVAPPESGPKASSGLLYRLLERGIRSGAPLASNEHSFVFFSETERIQVDVIDTRIAIRSLPRKDNWGRCSAEGELVERWLCRSGSAANAALIFAGEREGQLTMRAEVQGARATLAVSDRSVLVSGQCKDSSLPGYCLLSDGGTKDVVRPRSSPLALGLRGGTAFALHREDGATRDRFRLVDLVHGTSRSARVPDTKLLRELARGTILPRLHFTSDFGFWAILGEDFVGFTFSKSDLLAGPLQSQLRRTTFAGGRALSWGAVGFGKETTDGGITWSDLLLSEGGGDTAEVDAGLRSVGASQIGAVLGDRLRIGWGAPALRTVADEMRELPLPPLGGSRPHFHCDRAPGAPLRSDDEPRAREPHFPGHDATLPLSLGGLHAEVFLSGVAGPQFGRESRVFIEYHDPFSEQPLRSRPTRGLFASRADAEQALGLNDPSASFASGTLDSLGEAGVLFVRTRETLRAFGFERDGPIYEMKLPDSIPASGLLGVAKRHGAFYLAYAQSGRLELFREQSGALLAFASFPLEDAAGRFVALSEDELGNLAVVMDGEAGLFVFPLSEAGRLSGLPRVYENQSRAPPPCERRAGFAIARELAASPQIEGADGVLPLLSIRARLRAQDTGLCIEAMSARARAPVAVGTEPLGATPFPLAVFGASGRSLGTLRCR